MCSKICTFYSCKNKRRQWWHVALVPLHVPPSTCTKLTASTDSFLSVFICTRQTGPCCSHKPLSCMVALCHLHQQLCTFWPTYSLHEQLVHQHALMAQIVAHLLQRSWDAVAIGICWASPARVWLFTCEWRNAICITRTLLCILWIIVVC